MGQQQEHYRVCVVTSNRADWSKLEPLVAALHEDSALELQLLVVGCHLLMEFGWTVETIRARYPVTIATNTIVAGDSSESMVDSVAMAMIKLSSNFRQMKPDIVLIHGDRFDAFAAVSAASLAGIRVLHIEGGELSGSADGVIRHAITKLSHFHMVCNEEARQRVLQLGEEPSRVCLAGCPSYDVLLGRVQLPMEMSENDVLASYDVEPRKFLLVQHHPDTNNMEASVCEFRIILSVATKLKLRTLLFYPNVDPGNKALIVEIHRYLSPKHSHAAAATSGAGKPDGERRSSLEDGAPPQTDAEGNVVKQLIRPVTTMPFPQFAVLMRTCGCMVGNSSAGTREAPALGIPSIIIGSRQASRAHSHVSSTRIEHLTEAALEDALKANFGKRFEPTFLYGDGNATSRFISFLNYALRLPAGANKPFVDLQGVRAHITSRDATPLLINSHAPAAPATNGAVAATPSGKTRVLALVTARGGSKGIPGKNVKPLAGVPLVAWTVSAAKGAAQLDRVVVSTDDEGIAAACRDAGAEVPFMRPAELAGDKTPHMDVVWHALDALREAEGYVPDYLLILQPTSPFRTSADIDASISLALQRGCDAVVGVTEAAQHPTKVLELGDDGRARPCMSSPAGLEYAQRQALSKVYAENGAIYLQKAASLLRLRQEKLASGRITTPRTGSLYSTDIVMHVMPRERSVDIDEPWDWRIAELLAADLQREATGPTAVDGAA